MTTTQKQIDFEKTCVDICKLMMQFSMNDWTAEKIAYCIMERSSNVRKCLDHLIDKELVFKNNNSHGVTQAGRDYIEGVCINSALNIAGDVARHKEEALSGLKEVKSKKSGYMVSEKSKLTKAVLPTKTKARNNRDPELIFGEKDREEKGLIKIAKLLNLTVEKVAELYKEGRIRICKKCGEVGVFDRRGKGWQHECRKCKKGGKG